jgi:arsenite methyltransferase
VNSPINRRCFSLGFLLVLCGGAFAQQHQHHPPRSREAYARILENPARDEWQKPGEVVEALGLKPTEVIADIGSGTGYFARRFAPLVATVYAVDIDERFLEMARKDAPENLVFVLAGPDDPKLPSNSVDTIFFCNVLHHIDNRPAYYEKLKKALRPGGRLINIDFHKRPLPVGPPVGMKLSEEEVIEEFTSAGFRFTRSFDFLPHQYFLVFEKE